QLSKQKISEKTDDILQNLLQTEKNNYVNACTETELNAEVNQEEKFTETNNTIQKNIICSHKRNKQTII
ncbi:17769_t:CDS:1, partial [Cetraspora pellucida]